MAEGTQGGAYRVHWHVMSARSGGTADGEQPIAFQDESATPPHIVRSLARALSHDTPPP